MPILLLIGLLNFPQASIAAPPLHGNFSWKQLVGTYRYGPCVCEQGKPIWSADPETSLIEISDAADWGHGGQGDYLEMNRFNIPPGPIVPQWSLEKIDKGPQDRTDNSGIVDGHSESYTTQDGVFGIWSWNRPYNIGWSSLYIRKSASGQVTYEMQMQYDTDPVARVETCDLIPQ